MALEPYAPRKTFAESNQFHLKCPVFNVETPIRDCIKLRDTVWFGHRPTVRQGCQCCMKAGKCPINGIMSHMIRAGTDPYHSETKKVGELKDEHYQMISRVVVPDRMLGEFNLSESEAKLIRRQNEIVHSGVVVTRPRKLPKGELGAIPDAPEALSEDTQDDVTTAAIAGDMTAAVNKALENKDTA